MPLDALLLPALGLGLAYAAAPGAVNTECVRRGVAGGFRPAVLVQVGALTGDAAWATLALTGTAVLVRQEALRWLLGVAGGLFLLRLGWVALRAAWRHDPGGAPVTDRGDFATGVVF